MTRIGIAGHQNLPDAALVFVTAGIRACLVEHDDVIGYSCLAAGADQLFAAEVLTAGGRLHVVIPCAGYLTTLTGADAAEYRRLLAAADERTELAFPAPSETAYDAAGRTVAELSDVLIAVWDGEPARGLGGTGDVVAHARALGREVRVIWPPGLSRT